MKCGRFDAFGKLKFEEKNYYGALSGMVNCLVVFPTQFNPPNNSLLIILQISLPFTCIPALTIYCVLYRMKKLRAN